MCLDLVWQKLLWFLQNPLPVPFRNMARGCVLAFCREISPCDQVLARDLRQKDCVPVDPAHKSCPTGIICLLPHHQPKGNNPQGLRDTKNHKMDGVWSPHRGPPAKHPGCFLNAEQPSIVLSLWGFRVPLSHQLMLLNYCMQLNRDKAWLFLLQSLLFISSGYLLLPRTQLEPSAWFRSSEL